MSRITAALVVTALAAAAHAGTLDVGGEIPAWTLKDQSGTSRTLDDTAQRIYFTSDRKGDELLEGAMQGQDQTALDNQKAIVIADISKAPGFVRYIIRSGLKDRRYTTWLDDADTTAAALPHRKNRVTVLDVEARRIKAVRFIADVAGLREELNAAPPAKPTAGESPTEK